MPSLPEDFLSAPVFNVKVTRIDFANTPLPEYAKLQAYVIDDVFTSSECATLLSAAEASSPWQRAMIQVGNGHQRQEDDQRKCGRLIWDSPDVAQKIWGRVKVYVPEIARLGKHAEITGGGPIMRGEVWEASRLNERMRFLKYEGGQYFRVHEDGAYQTPDGSERSFFTFHLYLNGDGEISDASPSGDDQLKGGATTFHSYNMKQRYDVLPKTGRILIFQHRKLWHSGDDVVQGVKYTMRSDILYKQADKLEKETRMLQDPSVSSRVFILPLMKALIRKKSLLISDQTKTSSARMSLPYANMHKIARLLPPSRTTPYIIMYPHT